MRTKKEKSDDEIDSEVSEPYIGIKDTTYELIKNTTNNMDPINK